MVREKGSSEKNNTGLIGENTTRPSSYLLKNPEQEGGKLDQSRNRTGNGPETFTGVNRDIQWVNLSTAMEAAIKESAK